MWLNLAQTILLLVATGIALLTFVRTEHGRQVSQKIRRLEDVQDCVLYLVDQHTTADLEERFDRDPWIRVAQQRLRAALRLTGLQLDQTELLSRPGQFKDATSDAFDRQAEAALQELAGEIEKLG